MSQKSPKLSVKCLLSGPDVLPTSESLFLQGPGDSPTSSADGGQLSKHMHARKGGRMRSHMYAGGTYAPEGSVLDAQGGPVPKPADHTSVLRTAACCALCNDSALSYDPGLTSIHLTLHSSGPILRQPSDIQTSMLAGPQVLIVSVTL